MDHLSLEEQIDAAIESGDKDAIVRAIEGHAPTGDGARCPAAVKDAYEYCKAEARALVDQEKLARLW